MGRPVNNIRKFLLKKKLSVTQCKQLVALADTVVARMTGNANFATPAPTLLSVTGAADDLRAAAAKSNYKRNHGSKADRADTIAKATTLQNLLLALYAYVNTTATVAAPSDNVAFNQIVVTAGFGLRSVVNRQKSPQIPRFVRQMNNRQYNLASHYIRWKKPLGLLKGQPIDGYQIREGGTIIATTTKCSFSAGNLPLTMKTLEIVPFNSRGEGLAFTVNVQ